MAELSEVVAISSSLLSVTLDTDPESPTSMSP
ncbi:MAG: hypothetical protein DDT22_01177 [candidate division WS2 bacterium]|nr:hypothetical protein [Candidatus Lithacetigena glycinireducens]